MESRHLTMDDINKSALDHFVYQPVSREMIAYLAIAAQNVITCDASLMPQTQKNLPPTPPRSPEARCVTPEDDTLPTLEEFITQLVVSSNVQVPTLMSTLVYLTKLKSKLQPMARGLRCTTHRIFLACLILAAKYLNDSSPKNKHWANYTHIDTDKYSFGFNRTEVNLMEKQLLFLLEWDLRINEQDLYRELDAFLEPLRVRIAERHARKLRQREEKRRQQQMSAIANRDSSPASARSRRPSPAAHSQASSRSRRQGPEHMRSDSGDSVNPPGLTYSSSSSSYTPSIASSRLGSRSATPQTEPEAYPYDMHMQQSSFYDSPVQIVVEEDMSKSRMLPYEISPEQYQRMQDGMAKKRQRRGMWGRLLGGTVSVR